MRSKILALSLILVLVSVIVGFSPDLQGIQRFRQVITQSLQVNQDAEVRGDLVVTGDVTINGNIPNRSMMVRYQDVAAAPSIVGEATVVATVQAFPGTILGVDTPRNLSLTYVTATTATVGNITVVGVDARGLAATELIAVAAISGSQTLTGNVPWVSITSITLPERSEDVTLTVVGGKKFGLPIVPDAAGDVYHVTVNKTPQAAPTVNATYGTFDPVSTPAADVDYSVWMKE